MSTAELVALQIKLELERSMRAADYYGVGAVFGCANDFHLIRVETINRLKRQNASAQKRTQEQGGGA